MRRPRLLACLLPLAACLALAAPRTAARVVSLNPSLTAILLTLGARHVLVGVDDYSARQQPGLAGVPTVGGLFDPNLEAVLALAPDLVVMVPGAQQRDLGARLGALGVEVLELPNITLSELLASIEALGARVGRGREAAARSAAIRAAFEAHTRANAGRAPRRGLLVLQREPLFVVGAGSFLHEMLRAAGVENAAGGFAEPYPRVSLEWLIEAAPEILVDASPDPEDAAGYWRRWPSLPAVAAGRVVSIPAEELTLPGPHPERGLRRLADALRPFETAP